MGDASFWGDDSDPGIMLAISLGIAFDDDIEKGDCVRE